MNRILKIISSTIMTFGLVFFVGCEDDEVVETVYDSFDIQNVMSLTAGEDANAEIVRTVPGTDDKAVFVSSAIGRLTVIDYTTSSFAFGSTYDLDPGSATAEMTSIDVSIPIGGESYVAVCVAETDCAKGKIMFVKLSDGSIVSEVEVGYNPDGTAFTKDGSYLVVGVANASLVQDFAVDWDTDSEPEHAETSADGTVIVSIQETSQIMIFNVADAPLTEGEYTVVDLPDDGGTTDDGAGVECEPDGLFISPDGTMALISSERNGTFQLMALPSGTLYGNPYVVENDLPSGWQRDDRSYKKRTEPEECSLVEKSGKLYAVFALQESHAVIVYDVTDPANPVFDSMAPAGIDYENDNGMEKSAIGSEGLGMHQTNGVAFSANEREGSISMFTAAWARE